MSNAFTPREHGCTPVMVDGTNVQTVAVSVASTVWVDNRGTTDLLVEFLSNPLDVDSFRIPPKSSQPLSRPASATLIYLKRPTGSAPEQAYITQGYGI